jgi:hypothetical protein
MPLITGMRKEGRTLQAIADELTEQGHVTRQGKRWNSTQVQRVLARASVTECWYDGVTP